MKMNGNAISRKYNARSATHQIGQTFSLHTTFSSLIIKYKAVLL